MSSTTLSDRLVAANWGPNPVIGGTARNTQALSVWMPTFGLTKSLSRPSWAMNQKNRRKTSCSWSLCRRRSDCSNWEPILKCPVRLANTTELLPLAKITNMLERMRFNRILQSISSPHWTDTSFIYQIKAASFFDRQTVWQRVETPRLQWGLAWIPSNWHCIELLPVIVIWKKSPHEESRSVQYRTRHEAFPENSCAYSAGGR